MSAATLLFGLIPLNIPTRTWVFFILTIGFIVAAALRAWFHVKSEARERENVLQSGFLKERREFLTVREHINEQVSTLTAKIAELTCEIAELTCRPHFEGTVSVVECHRYPDGSQRIYLVLKGTIRNTTVCESALVDISVIVIRCDGSESTQECGYPFASPNMMYGRGQSVPYSVSCAVEGGTFENVRVSVLDAFGQWHTLTPLNVEHDLREKLSPESTTHAD